MTNNAQELVANLKKRNLTIALAESVTAGYASYLLTKIPGSSKIFKGSIVVYSLDAKQKLFLLPRSLLTKTQGVSDKVAMLLAKRVRKILGSDIGGAIVGFAGPGAKKGTKIGSVYLGLAAKNMALTQKHLIKGSRDMVRKKGARLLIALINEKLKSI